MNKQVEAMRKLGYTDEEIVDILEADKRIDRGEKLFELDPELEAGAKKARQADRKANSEPVKRERKANEVKAGLIELLSEVIKEQPACNSLEIVNNEREFVFLWMGTKYKVVLSAPRS